MEVAIETLNQWQTLAAGLLALGAAIATVCVLVRQLKLQKRQLDTLEEAARENWQRKLLARRAVLPADLSEIMRFAEECAGTVVVAMHMLRGDVERELLDLHYLPDRVVGNLQALIEQLEDSDANKIADLLACYQVQIARLNGELAIFNYPDRFGNTRIITEQNLEFTLEKIVEIFLLAEKMFRFARREDHELPEPQFTPEDVNQAIARLGLDGEISDRCESELSRLLVRAG